MTTTVDSLESCDIAATFPGHRSGHGKLKEAAVGLIGRGPKYTAVGLDDRATDGEAHPDPSRLGGEEAVKDAVHRRRVKPRSHVRDRDQRPRRTGSRAYPQRSRSFRDQTHRLDTVHDQIKDNLLKLNPIANDRSEIAS